MLRTYQKSQLAYAVKESGLKIEDFSLRPGNSDETFESIPEIFRIKCKTIDAEFNVFSRNGEAYNVVYHPSASSTNKSSLRNLAWSSLMQTLDSWLVYVRQDIESDDPWSELEDSESFKDTDEKFKPAELDILDKAIDESIGHLIDTANSKGMEITLESLTQEINELKAQARKETKGKWLERFKGYISGKIIDWGLEKAIELSVIQILYESAKPVLHILTSNLQM